MSATLDDERGCRQHELERNMGSPAGTWTTIEMANHRARIFEPAVPNPHGFVVVYLHCFHSASLRSYPAFMRELERY
jgi:hypothetical protein